MCIRDSVTTVPKQLYYTATEFCTFKMYSYYWKSTEGKRKSNIKMYEKNVRKRRNGTMFESLLTTCDVAGYSQYKITVFTYRARK